MSDVSGRGAKSTGPDLSADDLALAHDVQVAVLRLARRLRAQRRDVGLTLSQLSVLALLGRSGPMTLGDLAAAEQVRPPSMTRTVASLVELRMVDRSPSPNDGRQFVVSVTPAGRDLLAADRARREAWLADRLRDVSAADRDVLRRAVMILDELAPR
jgi:DNA-binding MarR family transcriptional regulator